MRYRAAPTGKELEDGVRPTTNAGGDMVRLLAAGEPLVAGAAIRYAWSMAARRSDTARRPNVQRMAHGCEGTGVTIRRPARSCCQMGPDAFYVSLERIHGDIRCIEYNLQVALLEKEAS